MPLKNCRILATHRMYNGFNKLEVALVEVDDENGGKVRHEREIIHHGDAAIVLLKDSARGVALLVRQWRAPLAFVGADPILEACGGIVDEGETAEQAAIREVEEEMGFRISSLVAHGAVYPSCGSLSEKLHLFVADVSEDDRVGAGGGVDEDEDVELVEIPLPELYQMAVRGDIQDAKTLILVQRLMLAERSVGG